MRSSRLSSWQAGFNCRKSINTTPCSLLPAPCSLFRRLTQHPPIVKQLHRLPLFFCTCRARLLPAESRGNPPFGNVSVLSFEESICQDVLVYQVRINTIHVLLTSPTRWFAANYVVAVEQVRVSLPRSW